MTVQPTSATWRDLNFATGADATYRILDISGWEGRPPSRYDKQVRTRAHGTYASQVWADERIVTIEGRSWSQDDRDSLFDALDRRFPFDGGEEPLTVSVAGRTLTAAAQLLRFDPVLTRETWGIGRFGWIAQWRCPDPLRYGPAQSTSTGLPSAGGGMSFPMVFPMDFGAAGNPGQLVLTNPGTAPAPIVFTVTPPAVGGFEISAAGQRLTYPVTSAETLTIDTAAGTVLAGGTADRRTNLTNADWLQVPAGGSLTVQFTSLGAYDASALLSATTRPAYW